MSQIKLEILGRLLKEESITLEEAFLLMQTEKQYIPSYPYWNTPYIPWYNQPWYTFTTNSGSVTMSQPSSAYNTLTTTT